ncbi:hypothetical protein Gpo141_00011246 [Globisporangium polare]
MKIVYTVSLALVALLSVSTTTSALEFSDIDKTAEVGADADAGVVTVVFAGAPADADVAVGDNEVRENLDDDDEVGADADMDFGTEHIFANPEVRQSIITAVNTKRADAGLAALCLNFKLHNTAQSQASYMAKTNLISFISEDGFNPSQRGRSARFNSSGVAEIIGAGFTKAEDLVASWLKSNDSMAILLGNFTHMGPGYSVNASQPYVNYWVVDFAKGYGESCSNVTSVY